MTLTARDALTEVARVFKEDRPPAEQNAEHLYAVFAQPRSDGALSLQGEQFLGLVIAQDVARHPGRIFAELLPRPSVEAVLLDTKIKEVLARLDTQRLYALPVLDEGGRFTGAVTRTSALGACLGRNRRAASNEAALKEREAQLRALLEAVPDLLFRIRGDGTYLDCKPAAGFPTYVPPAECLGKKATDVLPPAVAEESLRLIGRALERSEVQIHEYRLVVQDEPRDYEARTCPAGRTRCSRWCAT